ncbi:hypothetical protein N431DRAFT_489194 [Stipitochalara longipes BDJ]|nr:hypothetical protein N431DRAFT_489194 [Stipitochalara longipes BDJ]
MSWNYPLPSKASLVQQFVGKTLKEIPLPAAVIDIAAVRRNCQRMSNAVKDLGFDFAPLVNVHKTVEIARLQIGDDPEQARILATNLSEVENLLPLFLEYQKEGKQVNVIYGVPVAPSQIERVANIARILGRRGGFVRLLVQHASQIPLLQQVSRLSGYPVYVYIHVDVHNEPCGVHPGSQALQDLFSQIERIVLEGPMSMIGPGLYCHLEQGSFILDPTELHKPFTQQLSGLLDASPIYNIRFSINATAAILQISELLTSESDNSNREPTIALQTTLNAISQADNFIEVRDGDFALMDLNVLARKEVLGLGKAVSRDLQTVALTILTEVCCIYTSRGQRGLVLEEDDRGEALIALGSSTLGQTPSKLYAGYGLVSHWNVESELQGVLDGFSSFYASSVTPECAVLKWDGPPESVPQLQLGQRLRVYPNNASETSEKFEWYFVINSSLAGREDEIVDIFVRWRG